jgi:hypothetical protein
MTKLWLTGSGALALAVNSASTAQPAEPPPVVHAWPKLHTPDQITPAVLPYLACLYARRGLPPLHAPDGSLVAYDRSSPDCSAARAQASADAAKLLQAKPPGDGSSASALIDRTLSDIDDYVAALPVLGRGGTGGTGIVGVPLTIEDEVQPAYARYDACLKTQVSDSQVTVNSIVAKFREAMTICRSVRDSAVAEATQALAKKGWDQATRSRTAEGTFAKVDESWLVMGEQYRQLLIGMIAQRLAKNAPPKH